MVVIWTQMGSHLIPFAGNGDDLFRGCKQRSDSSLLCTYIARVYPNNGMLSVQKRMEVRASGERNLKKKKKNSFAQRSYGDLYIQRAQNTKHRFVENLPRRQQALSKTHKLYGRGQRSPCNRY